MADERLAAAMRALNLIERAHKDGREAWIESWEADPDQKHTAMLLSQFMGFFLANDAQRRDMSWDELFDQFRQEAVQHLG
ncbi:hypothetical protein [Streptomyces bobili]|uniref:hypothetical protein n=1 Tax=Streptomyces bobili TaxID=67280 RepID=UPI0037B39B7C